jgi:putative ABC transport system permease protein
MVISPLRLKVLRDLRRLWAQVLAIALVLAAGVATLILGNGAYSSLYETRARYYGDYRFADVFADVTRAPRALLGDIREIDNVLAAEARIVKLALLDMPAMAEPGTMFLVSLPEEGDRGLNLLHLRQGRLPDRQSAREVVVSEGFAAADGADERAAAQSAGDRHRPVARVHLCARARRNDARSAPLRHRLAATPGAGSGL